MRWRRHAGFWCSALLLALSASAFAASEDRAGCGIPEDLARVDAALPALRARLKAGGPVRIVAIGGGSTAGTAAGSADLAYPHRLQERLSEWFPAVPITVVNRGFPRQSAEQMLARFDRDVLGEHPVLVTWETGIHEAVHGLDVDDFARAVQRGIDLLRAHGIDIVLIDMQFSRTTESLIDFETYLKALHRIGEVNSVYVFPRWEIMRYWSEQHMFDFESVAKEQRARLAADVYRCIGRRLADAIRAATR